MSIHVPKPSYGAVDPGAPAPGVTPFVEEPRAGSTTGGSNRMTEEGTSGDPGSRRAEPTTSGEPTYAARPTRQSSASARTDIDRIDLPPCKRTFTNSGTNLHQPSSGRQRTLGYVQRFGLRKDLASIRRSRPRRRPARMSALGDGEVLFMNEDGSAAGRLIERYWEGLLEAIARRDLAALDHRTDRLSAVSHLWGPAGLVGELASLQRADTPERLDRYRARIAATPAFYDAELEIMREGIADGVTAPRIVAERALAQSERLLAAGADDSPALAPVPADDDAGRELLTRAIADHLLPALERYRAGVRDYLPNATETIGLSALPGGDAMYAAQILSWTTLELDAREVHELGTQDLERIQEERARSAAILGYPDAATAEAGIAQHAAFRFASPDELKAVAEAQVRRSWDVAPAWFGRVPSANCEVRLVEAFREAAMPFAFYNQPPEDGSRPGVYYVNGFDLERKPKHHLASTTYHEANPGHHFQIALEQEMDG